jgi:hypothetical protein
MIKIPFTSIIFLLISVVSFSTTALSAEISDNKDTADKIETIDQLPPAQHHLVTLPSTNRKRVDVMCIKFLSVIPKAKLVPKTEESTVYRLIADTFDSIEPTKKRKAELMRHCESPFVLKNDQGYSVIAGSQLTEDLAVAEQKRLAGKNISTTIIKLSLPLKQWQMKSTESFPVREAVIMANKLARMGVITTIEQAVR